VISDRTGSGEFFIELMCIFWNILYTYTYIDIPKSGQDRGQIKAQKKSGRENTDKYKIKYTCIISKRLFT
jgi:hypothetical protein